MNRLLIIALSIITFLVASLLDILNYLNFINVLHMALISLLVGFYLITIIIIIRTLKDKEEFRELVTKQNEYNDNLNNFITVLRSERHDFMNHFTVLGGLLSIGKADLAGDYLKDVLKKTKTNTQLMVLKQPVLIALLNGKLSQTENKGIKFNFKLESSLEYLSINSIDITAIFGNLIDNAIDAASLENNSAFILFQTSESPSTYTISVSNSGPSISEEIQSKMFSVGFSTKGSGRGYGLSIVMSAVEKYSGILALSLNPTTFSVTFPKIMKTDD